LTATDQALKRRLASTERRGHLRAFLLVLPLLLFVFITFAAPVILLLTRAIYDPSIADTLP
jgi:putative spermidine/putrescine transport system permease protein